MLILQRLLLLLLLEWSLLLLLLMKLMLLLLLLVMLLLLLLEHLSSTGHEPILRCCVSVIILATSTTVGGGQIGTIDAVQDKHASHTHLQTHAHGLSPISVVSDRLFVTIYKLDPAGLIKIHAVVSSSPAVRIDITCTRVVQDL